MCVNLQEDETITTNCTRSGFKSFLDANQELWEPYASSFDMLLWFNYGNAGWIIMEGTTLQLLDQETIDALPWLDETEFVTDTILDRSAHRKHAPLLVWAAIQHCNNVDTATKQQLLETLRIPKSE